MLSRGEWFTAYTPYQAEIAQGTLQSIFEFQTMICELTGMEAANASMYDGATGTAEAALMAARITRREKLVIARTLHPEYREVVSSYTAPHGFARAEVGYGENGRVDLTALAAAVDDKTAAVIVQSPNFFGTLEDLSAIAEIAHKSGALLVVAITEALSLALVEPPSVADIVALEAQSFGIPLCFGGPSVGVLATRDKYIRQIPGRLVGETKDANGKRGFVLTLSTREQHIRREKATSNICSNQALMALAANIFLDVYGREGLRELARQNLAKAAYAQAEFGKNAELLFTGAPRFNEFVLRTGEEPEALAHRLAGKGIVGGYPLKNLYPELGNASLWCVTELNTRGQIDAAAAEVR
jgi:glycine dehydrogenase subunit 1